MGSKQIEITMDEAKNILQALDYIASRGLICEGLDQFKERLENLITEWRD